MDIRPFDLDFDIDLTVPTPTYEQHNSNNRAESFKFDFGFALSPEESSCSLCYEGDTAVDVIIRPCGHRFHGQCLLHWVRQTFTCPVCRSKPDLFDGPSHVVQSFEDVWNSFYCGAYKSVSSPPPLNTADFLKPDVFPRTSPPSTRSSSIYEPSSPTNSDSLHDTAHMTMDIDEQFRRIGSRPLTPIAAPDIPMIEAKVKTEPLHFTPVKVEGQGLMQLPNHPSSSPFQMGSWSGDITQTENTASKTSSQGIIPSIECPLMNEYPLISKMGVKECPSTAIEQLNWIPTGEQLNRLRKTVNINSGTLILPPCYCERPGLQLDQSMTLSLPEPELADSQNTKKKQVRKPYRSVMVPHGNLGLPMPLYQSKSADSFRKLPAAHKDGVWLRRPIVLYFGLPDSDEVEAVVPRIAVHLNAVTTNKRSPAKGLLLWRPNRSKQARKVFYLHLAPHACLQYNTRDIQVPSEVPSPSIPALEPAPSTSSLVAPKLTHRINVPFLDSLRYGDDPFVLKRVYDYFMSHNVDAAVKNAFSKYLYWKFDTRGEINRTQFEITCKLSQHASFSFVFSILFAPVEYLFLDGQPIACNSIGFAPKQHHSCSPMMFATAEKKQQQQEMALQYVSALHEFNPQPTLSMWLNQPVSVIKQSEDPSQHYLVLPPEVLRDSLAFFVDLAPNVDSSQLDVHVKCDDTYIPISPQIHPLPSIVWPDATFSV